ncbi:MAG: hypothetical protein HZC44_12070 [Geobacter sp.]|nr:hypothetical protein [Geobacter sp.]
MSQRVYVTILFLMLIILATNSIPLDVCYGAIAAPIVSEITQPDGTKIKVRERGDEWNNWTETVDGYTIIQDKETRWWYYAGEDETKGIKMSQHPVGKIDPKNFNLKKGLLPKMKEHKNQLPPRRYLSY